jgi:hypothetical protein
MLFGNLPWELFNLDILKIYIYLLRQIIFVNVKYPIYIQAEFNSYPQVLPDNGKRKKPYDK